MLDKEKLINEINKLMPVKDLCKQCDTWYVVEMTLRNIINKLNNKEFDIKLANDEFINIFQECEKCYKLVGNTYITKFLNSKTIAVYHIECWDENPIKEYEKKIISFISKEYSNSLDEEYVLIKLKYALINGDFR